MAYIGAGAVVLVMIGATVYWAVRYPFSRIFFDLGTATAVGALLSLIIGPFIGGSARRSKKAWPRSSGSSCSSSGSARSASSWASVGTIVAGKDWKSRGLKRYEERYQKRPHRTVR